VNDVYVVIFSEGQTRRFATEDLGGGRYRTAIIFPTTGGWDLRVRYGTGGYGAGEEILLGKGAICVGGDVCVGGQPAQGVSSQPDGRTRTAAAPVIAAAALVVALAAALTWFGAFGRRQRLPRAG
jgi:hypothetical protein